MVSYNFVKFDLSLKKVSSRSYCLIQQYNSTEDGGNGDTALVRGQQYTSSLHTNSMLSQRHTKLPLAAVCYQPIFELTVGYVINSVTKKRET